MKKYKITESLRSYQEIIVEADSEKEAKKVLRERKEKKDERNHLL